MSFMLSVIILSVVVLIGIILGVIVLSVIIFSVVALNVVAPGEAFLAISGARSLFIDEGVNLSFSDIFPFLSQKILLLQTL
jgi:hypothetical protein